MASNTSLALARGAGAGAGAGTAGAFRGSGGGGGGGGDGTPPILRVPRAVGPRRLCLPRHTLALNSRHEGVK